MLDFSVLKLNNKDPVYMQIASYIKKQILLGHVVSGDMLPSRRETALMLNINPNTAQKAFKLMEEEGYVVTSGNTGSIINVNKELFDKIDAELTRDMVREFIKEARDINLSFKRVFDLISEMWEDV